MATYSVTTTARQDAVLTRAAAKRSVTVAALMNAALMKVLKQYEAEIDADDAQSVGAAYVTASNAVQNQVKAALGLS